MDGSYLPSMIEAWTHLIWPRAIHVLDTTSSQHVPGMCWAQI